MATTAATTMAMRARSADEVEARGPATLKDLAALPEATKGEIINGILYTQPRPRQRHSRAQYRIGSVLDDPFDRGRGGPGGWYFLIEPGIQLPRSPEVAPDVAGWRRSRLPEFTEGRIAVVPDWVCEVLSPGNRRYDIRIKRPFYARIGVPYLWLVDPDACTLECYKLVAGRWVDIGTYAGSDVVRAEPFDAVALRLEDWWGEVAVDTAAASKNVSSRRAKKPAKRPSRTRPR